MLYALEMSYDAHSLAPKNNFPFELLKCLYKKYNPTKTKSDMNTFCKEKFIFLLLLDDVY